MLSVRYGGSGLFRSVSVTVIFFLSDLWCGHHTTQQEEDGKTSQLLFRTRSEVPEALVNEPEEDQDPF